MADYTAIYSVGFSLAQYLTNNLPSDLKRQFPNLQFQLVSSTQIAQEDTTQFNEVVSIYLHRITIDENFRSAMQIQDTPNKKPVLFLDLHYLITYWGTDPQEEQTILGWTMSQLQMKPILDKSILSPANIWGPTESIQIVPADLTLDDILRIWDGLGPNYRLSLAYLARVLRIDVSDAPGPPVVATRFQLTDYGVPQ